MLRQNFWLRSLKSPELDGLSRIFGIKYMHLSRIKKSDPRIWTNYQEGKNYKIETNLYVPVDGN